jgi:hypothetical protein
VNQIRLRTTDFINIIQVNGENISVLSDTVYVILASVNLCEINDICSLFTNVKWYTPLNTVSFVEIVVFYNKITLSICKFVLTWLEIKCRKKSFMLITVE